MTDMTEIAARYGVPTPEELVAEYKRRGMRWIRDDFYRDDGDDGECCCAAGMLVLMATDDPSVLPKLDHGLVVWGYLRGLPRWFVEGVITGNDGWARPGSDAKPERIDGWEYGTAVRLEVPHE